MNINEIDKQYLITPASWEKLNKDCSLNELSDEDYEFYKPRIFKITKDILKDKDVDKKIKKCFIDYVKVCIEHFKFKDKSNTIQQDYLKYNQKKSTTVVTDISFNNKIIMKQKPQRIPKINNHINVKKKKQKKTIKQKIKKKN